MAYVPNLVVTHLPAICLLTCLCYFLAWKENGSPALESGPVYVTRWYLRLGHKHHAASISFSDTHTWSPAMLWKKPSYPEVAVMWRSQATWRGHVAGAPFGSQSLQLLLAQMPDTCANPLSDDSSSQHGITPSLWVFVAQAPALWKRVKPIHWVLSELLTYRIQEHITTAVSSP